MGNYPGLGSVWVSGQVLFPGYTVNNYPRSTFDLAVFGGKLKIANCETYGLLAVVPLFLIRQYPVVKKRPHEKKSN